MNAFVERMDITPRVVVWRLDSDDLQGANGL
jgi:hypothetical protein